MKLLRRILIFSLIIFFVFLAFKKASNDREWTDDMAVLAGVTIDNSEEGKVKVNMKNLRDSIYEGEKETIRYYADEFDLQKIEKMWFLVEPFSKWEMAAHTFFVFDFEDGQTVAFSVEARKQKDQKYSALRGLFKEYELYYMFGSEKDLILRRTDFLDHEVYMYPVKTTKENLQKLFLSIALEAKKLEEKPKFYNTITSSCTTTLVRHINDTSPGKVKFWQMGQYLPGLSDRLAYDLGLLDIDTTLETAKEEFSIKKKANDCKDSHNFSQCLRMALTTKEEW